MIKLLEDKIDEVSMWSMDGPDYEVKFGYLESLNFCIRQHKRGWNINQFKDNLDKVKQDYGKYGGEYLDGLISGLKYNIKHMEGK